MLTGIILNHTQKKELKEKVLLKYGIQLKHMKIKNGKKIKESLNRADAHPYGARPFKRINYVKKFLTLTKNIVSKKETDRFLKNVQNLRKIKPGNLYKLNIVVNKSYLKKNSKKGIF